LLTVETKKVEPDIVVFELKGRIILGRESKRIEWQLEDCLKQNQKKFIFDLSGVEYIDSSGIGIIVFCSGRTKQAGGELRVGGAKGLVRDVLVHTKVNEIVGFYPSAEEAEKSFA